MHKKLRKFLLINFCENTIHFCVNIAVALHLPCPRDKKQQFTYFR